MHQTKEERRMKMTDANPDGPAEEQPDDLSARQRAFCAEYLVDRNGTQAAVRAGYAPRSAKQQASRLLAHPKVKASITAALEQLALGANVRAEDVVAKLRQIAWSTPGGTWRSSDIVKALEILARHLGMFQDKLSVDIHDPDQGGVVLLPEEHDCPVCGMAGGCGPLHHNSTGQGN
jgi:phage terminase small subunit